MPTGSVHKFWDSQPHRGKGDQRARDTVRTIDPSAAAPETPLPLPAGFRWVTVDLGDDAQVARVHTLLLNHYVEDRDALFRFSYRAEFLRWALQVPGFEPDWLLGVEADGELVAFIAGTPAAVSLYAQRFPRAVAVNFLCVHRMLRQRRLAPVLIKELTRRAHRAGVVHAVFTAGAQLPEPLGACRYFHRAINVPKLLETGFLRLEPGQMASALVARNALPAQFTRASIRRATPADAPALLALYTEGMRRAGTAFFEELDAALAAHRFLPAADFVQTFVNADAAGTVTDFFSFYSLPSQALAAAPGAPAAEVRIAYQHYCFGRSLDRGELLENCVIAAAAAGHDVFNCLNLQDNAAYFEKLRFAPGDGTLYYYTFNIQSPPVPGEKIGIIIY